MNSSVNERARLVDVDGVMMTGAPGESDSAYEVAANTR